MVDIPSKDIELANRIKDLRDIDEPRCAKSKTDKELEKRA
jgi:hypothetical protein